MLPRLLDAAVATQRMPRGLQPLLRRLASGHVRRRERALPAARLLTPARLAGPPPHPAVRLAHREALGHRHLDGVRVAQAERQVAAAHRRTVANAHHLRREGEQCVGMEGWVAGAGEG